MVDFNASRLAATWGKFDQSLNLDSSISDFFRFDDLHRDMCLPSPKRRKIFTWSVTARPARPPSRGCTIKEGRTPIRQAHGKPLKSGSLRSLAGHGPGGSKPATPWELMRKRRNETTTCGSQAGHDLALACGDRRTTLRPANHPQRPSVAGRTKRPRTKRKLRRAAALHIKASQSPRPLPGRTSRHRPAFRG